MSLVIKAEKRKDFGKNASRVVRRKGQVPAILYGPGMDNVALTLEKTDLFYLKLMQRYPIPHRTGWLEPDLPDGQHGTHFSQNFLSFLL